MGKLRGHEYNNVLLRDDLDFFLIDISKNTQTLILTIFSGAIATYEDS
jgi:hypothetical protein